MLTRALARRQWLIGAAAAVAAPRLVTAAGAATPLVVTPRQTEGPFYPPELPAETDSDLVRVAGADARALGQVAHIVGRVLDRQGRPLSGAMVEIWQCDANGRYLHPGAGRRDPGFQGIGLLVARTSAAATGSAIRPVAYPGRAPHIHVKVWRRRGGAVDHPDVRRGRAPERHLHARSTPSATPRPATASSSPCATPPTARPARSRAPSTSCSPCDRAEGLRSGAALD